MLRLLLFMSMLFASPALAAGITDRAGLYSKTTLEESTYDLSLFSRHAKEDVYIDTFKKAPSAGSLSDWSTDNAPSGNGIYIVITREPKEVQVVIDHSQVFNGKDTVKITSILEDGLQRGSNDQALIEALNYVKYTQADRRSKPNLMLIWGFIFLVVMVCTMLPDTQRPLTEEEKAAALKAHQEASSPSPGVPMESANYNMVVGAAIGAAIVETTINHSDSSGGHGGF